MKYLGSCRIALGAALVCGLLSSAVAQAPAADSKAPAEKILRSAAAKLRDAKAFTVHAYLKRIRGDEKGGEVLELDADIAVVKPRQLRVVSKPPRWKMAGAPLEGDNGLAVSNIYCDGRKIDYVMPSLGKYVRGDAPANISEIFEHGALPAGVNFAGILIFPVFLRDDPYAVMTSQEWPLEYAGEGEVDGVACHILLQRTSGPRDVKIWIEKDGQTFRQIATDSTRAAAEGMQVLAPEMITRFTDWNFSPKLKDPDFEYSPPPTLKNVAQFMDDAG